MTRLRVLRGGVKRGDAGEREADRALLKRVVKGDAEAHRALFDRYYPGVYSFVRRRVGDEGLAEEVAADVFFELWRHAASYRGESPVSSWLFGIAQLKVLSARRHQSQPRRAALRLTPDDVLMDFPDPQDAVTSLDARQQLMKLLSLLERMPAGQREVLRLAFLEGRSYAEIAEELGISEANVKTRINRARTRLRGSAQLKG